MDIQRELTGTSTQASNYEEDGTASLPGLDAMLSPETPEKAEQHTQVGVKAHIERHDPHPECGNAPALIHLTGRGCTSRSGKQ